LFCEQVDSTHITAQIGHADGIGRYYSIFLNAMATISKNFGAKVIKYVGDSLIFYFPDTNDSRNKSSFKEVLECFSGIIAARGLINKRLFLERLPDQSYRLSADYGRVEVGTAVSSGTEDFFGPTVNMCAKMNPHAERNGIVIGGDLYQVIKRFSFDVEFEFKQVHECPSGLKRSYPLYSVTRRDKKFQDNLLSSILKKPRSLSKERSVLATDFTQTELRKRVIMLVEDEPDVLIAFKSFLLGGGYNVAAFSDSYRALQVFARSEPRHFDLIILDIRMPLLNGLQLYERLKAIDPHIKVVFLTALDATEELISVLDGVTPLDVMKKPIDRKHFLRKIRASLETSLLRNNSNSNASHSVGC